MKKYIIPALILLFCLTAPILGETIQALPIFKIEGTTAVPRDASWTIGTSTTVYYGDGSNLSGIGGTGTVTSVDMSVPTGLSISGNPITATGTLALDYDTGYEGVKTASTTQWQTAYGWGDWSGEGFLTTETVPIWTAASSSYYQIATDSYVYNTGDTITGNLIVEGTSTLATTTITNLTISEELIITGVVGSALDMNGYLITNIGDSGTDFTSGGGLTLAGDLVVNGASTIKFPLIGSPTYTDLYGWWDSTQSAGKITGGEFTDNGDGTINVNPITGIIKTTNSIVGANRFFDLATSTNIALVDNDTNYIYIDYNGGSPTVTSTVTKSDANNHDKVLVGKVYREGLIVHLIDAGMLISDNPKNTLGYLTEVFGEVTRASGFVISETGTRNLASTDGVLYAGLTRVTTTGIDTSVSGYFTTYYYDSANWISATTTDIDNTYYNNPASGLVELTANRYGVFWVYGHDDGDIIVVYGQGDYTLTNAELAQPPSSLPGVVNDFGFSAAKIIIKKSDPSFTGLESAYDTSFTASGASVHNELAGLQGGTAAEYYHLTSAQHTPLIDIASITPASSLIAGDGLGGWEALTQANLITNNNILTNTNTKTVTNKTITFGGNTITGTMAEFDIAVTDGNIAYSGGAFHDGFSDFVANEHIDWTSTASNFNTSGNLTAGGVITFNTGLTGILRVDSGVLSTTTVAGDVTKVGTPVDNQIGVWTGDGTIEGTSGLTYNGTNLLLTGDIGATGTRITKGWFTDLTVTNAIAGSVTGNAGTVSTITTLAPDTATTQATQPNITSLGTLTILAVDNITINGNDISSTAGTDLTITPLAGQQIVLDGTVVIDAGVITGATSISSTAFVGALTGQAETVATITGLAPDTATTQATQGNITTASALVSIGTITTGVWNGTAIDIGTYTNLTAGRSLTLTDDDVLADVELYTDEKGAYIESPVVESLDNIMRFMNDVTITYVQCQTDVGTVSFNIEDGSDNNILSAELVCDAGGQSSCASGCDVNTINGTYDNITALSEPIDFDSSAVASDPTVLNVFIGYTKDD